MRSIYKKALFSILLISSILLCHIHTYASFIIDTTTPHISPIEDDDMLSKLGVTGDSYGGFLVDELCARYTLDLQNYCKAATTIEENKNRIIECIYDRYKYIILSIGVNDHLMQTDINTFIDQVNFFALLAKALGKHLILHTYMTYPLSISHNTTYTCADYDYALRLIDGMYDCVRYIDMSDVNGEAYVQEDRIHYNNIFYDILIDRLLYTLDEIKSENET